MSYRVDEIDYKGFTINVYQDDIPANPFEEWDCEPDIIVAYSGRGYGYDIHEYGNTRFAVPTLTREQIVKHIEDILNLVGYSTLLSFCRKESYFSDYSWGADLVNDALSNYFEGLHTFDQMDFLEGFYNTVMEGYTALCKSSHGYRQGDYANVLVIATPEWQNGIGCKIDNPDKLKSTIDLYGYWAWGDVYGFVVEDEYGEHIDSCWGYYGPIETSGLIDDAEGSIDYQVEKIEREEREAFEKDKKKKQTKIKAMIKNHVPLCYRAKYLNNAVEC